MAALSAQRISIAGTAPSYAAASAGGDTAPIGGGLVLHVRNGGASPITVNITTPGTIDGLAVADAALSIPAAGAGFIPLSYVYRDPVTGLASVSYSATASVTVAVVQV
ncbi:hypothetical protein [Streptomyces sp. NPDC000851]